MNLFRLFKKEQAPPPRTMNALQFNEHLKAWCTEITDHDSSKFAYVRDAGFRAIAQFMGGAPIDGEFATWLKRRLDA